MIISEQEEQDSTEILELLSKRAEYLMNIVGSAKEKNVLVDEIGMSRSTVDDVIRSLEHANLVERGNNGYQTTFFGILAAAEYELYVQRIKQICMVAPVIDKLPPDTQITTEFFIEAEAYISEAHVPNAPVHRVMDHLRESHQIKIVSSIAMAGYINLFNNLSKGGEVNIELILPSRAIKYIISNYGNNMYGFLNQDNVKMYEIPSFPPFSLFLLGDRNIEQAQLLIHRKRGVHGLIINNTTISIKQAKQVYRTYRSEATVLSG